MKPVLTKKDFVRRYQNGEFGNRSPTWTIDEWLDYSARIESCRGLYHLRNRVAGGETFYDLNRQQLIERIHEHGQHKEWRNQQRWENWYISQMAPTERTLIQGELQRTSKGLYLRYSTVRKPMRDALASSQEHVWGLLALTLFKYYMDPLSYEWLGYLLETYEDHVIEFSTYGVNFGTIPGRNTIVWEVRKY